MYDFINKVDLVSKSILMGSFYCLNNTLEIVYIVGCKYGWIRNSIHRINWKKLCLKERKSKEKVINEIEKEGCSTYMLSTNIGIDKQIGNAEFIEIIRDISYRDMI